ncbi:DUF5403 family protein [Streptomyces sp. LP11]|uniref:DUF5403 family protein n=1 Tax=Streptomyces pyxinicus TaxID=2970331 RepID=A0ABT2AXW7_9ACTN|nr:DUF5403 family protein [Streptomyces sp. LP11]MCS0601103.1 DUF5403 family protein [Streptomyces sp. LP11]
MSIEWLDNGLGSKFKNVEDYLALIDGVQLALEEKQFLIRVRAEENLQRARAGKGKEIGALDPTGATVEVERGRVDRYVVLEDHAVDHQGGNPNSALAIELGRNAYDVTLLNAEGETVNKYTVGSMEGLFILTDAADLPHRDGGGAKVKRHVRIRMKKGGGGGRTSIRD